MLITGSRLAASLVLITSTPALAEMNLTPLTSYRDMHRDSDYGTLFFNKDAVNPSQNKWKKSFFEILKDGHLTLPKQRGYCFLLTHYRSGSQETGSFHYKVRIKKTFRNGKSKSEIHSSQFVPTPLYNSNKFPDVCVSGLRGVKNVELEFSTTDPRILKWNISFSV